MSLFFNLFKGYKKSGLWKAAPPQKKLSIHPWHYSIKSYICLHTKRPYRLVAQDSGFSFPQQRFETAWGYKEKACFLASLFRYPRANRDTGYKKDQPQGWSGGIRKRTGNQADPFSYAKALVPNLQNGKSPSIGGRQYFTSWNERLLNKLQIHQNRIHGSLLCCLFLLKAK